MQVADGAKFETRFTVGIDNSNWHPNWCATCRIPSKEAKYKKTCFFAFCFLSLRRRLARPTRTDVVSDFTPKCLECQGQVDRANDLWRDWFYFM